MDGRIEHGGIGIPEPLGVAAHARSDLPTGRTVGGRGMAAAEDPLVLPSVPIVVRRAGEAGDLFQIAFDRSAGLIRAFAAGAWTLDETRQYLAGLDAFVKGSRAFLGKARVLLDRREVSVQSTDVAALLASANGKIFQPDDRIAIVVTTSMAKANLRQRMPHPGSKAFLSIDAAETWLQAFDGRR